MPDYNFHTLSPIDFEILSRDLLQCELTLTLESFKPGKDLGIDFRAYIDKSNLIVVQCKHYVETGYKGLYHTLKSKELPKIKKLNPQRYILITSTSLSPNEKDKLVQLLTPYVKKTSDIVGKDDINNLLGKFPEIEKKHFKLWLSSINVLENILNAKILRETDIEKSDIQEKARLYVINESFCEALSILKQNHYCIIAGIPGIGKTMLAKMIVLQYLLDDYEFISISKDISDAFSFSPKSKTRIYLYDDFLGRTALSEKLEKNEELRLSKFIEHINRSDGERLILTTREYILHQAQRVYEPLNEPIFNKPQCIIDLSKYTRDIKAKILFNHLYFSKIDRKLINEIINTKAYIEIIDHENFNPRIIEYMTNANWLNSYEENEYPKQFINNLTNPSLVWERVFTSQISKNARDLLVVLVTLPFEVFVEDLFNVFLNYKKLECESLDDVEFHEILKELDGNFTKTNKSKYGIYISFHNPSIVDYIEYYISDKHKIIYKLLSSALFYEQVEFILREETIHNHCAQNHHDFTKLIIEKISHTITAQSCSLANWSDGRNKPTYKNRSIISIGQRYIFVCSKLQNSNYNYLNQWIGTEFQNIKQFIKNNKIHAGDLNSLMNKLLVISSITEKDKIELLSLSKQSLFENSYSIENVEDLLTLLKNFENLKEEDDDSRINSIVRSIVNNYSENDEDWLNDELYTLQRIAKEYNLNFDYEVDAIQDILSNIDNLEKDDPIWDYKGEKTNNCESITDDDIENMFESLRIDA
jgi:hypothetical protein